MNLQNFCVSTFALALGACSSASTSQSFTTLGGAGGATSGLSSANSSGSGGGTGGTPTIGAPSGPSLIAQGGASTPSGSSVVDAGSSIPGELTAIIRDFKYYDSRDPTTNPDFENYPTTYADGGTLGRLFTGTYDDRDIVADVLDDDRTPAYKGGSWTTHGADAFHAWFHDVPDTNLRVEYPITLTSDGAGTWSYDSEKSGTALGRVAGGLGMGAGTNANKKEFFPIDDGTPYATKFGDQGAAHNYSFTLELHTVFKYHGGEHFHFRGDDDVFVYINGKLAINLGGIHNSETADVKIDTLGLTVGQTYPLDFFYAERHTTESNLLIETTLELTVPAEIH